MSANRVTAAPNPLSLSLPMENNSIVAKVVTHTRLTSVDFKKCSPREVANRFCMKVWDVTCIVSVYKALVSKKKKYYKKNEDVRKELTLYLDGGC